MTLKRKAKHLQSHTFNNACLLKRILDKNLELEFCSTILFFFLTWFFSSNCVLQNFLPEERKNKSPSFVLLWVCALFIFWPVLQSSKGRIPSFNMTYLNFCSHFKKGIHPSAQVHAYQSLSSEWKEYLHANFNTLICVKVHIKVFLLCLHAVCPPSVLCFFPACPGIFLHIWCNFFFLVIEWLRSRKHWHQGNLAVVVPGLIKTHTYTLTQTLGNHIGI